MPPRTMPTTPLKSAQDSLKTPVAVGLLRFLGSSTLEVVAQIGRWAVMLSQGLLSAFRPPFRLRAIFKQLESVGVDSTIVSLLTGSFTGAVFTLQVIYGFRQFQAEALVGPVVALAMCRELGPVLTALMVTGRVGGAMAAELGTMRVTEQLDALTVMAADPVKFMVSPRILSGIIMLPLLTIVADFMGILGGYLVAVAKGMDPGVFVSRIQDVVTTGDIVNGLIKASVFGLILTSVGCYKGFYSKGGAEGVGRSTTQAVVISCVAILIIDLIMTAIMF